MNDLAHRFFNFVRIGGADECWPWEGCRQRQGYGNLAGGASKLAHRVSYELHKGQIPTGMMVLHSCDNPPCVNPKHLSVGTAIDNIADMVAKRRHIEGRKRSHEKLRARTHCKHGHEYSVVGFYQYARGRVCKLCTSDRMRLQYVNRIGAAA